MYVVCNVKELKYEVAELYVVAVGRRGVVIKGQRVMIQVECHTTGSRE